MKQFIKILSVMLVIALSLTSDTASRSTRVSGSRMQVPGVPAATRTWNLKLGTWNSELTSLASLYGFAAIGQMPKSWGCRSWTSREAMLPSESRRR